MSTEPTSLTHENPQDARRASAIARDGTLLYVCARCLQPKPTAQYDNNDYGRIEGLCRDCKRLTSAGLPTRKYMKDRSHITIDSKVCRMCGEDRPSLEFWLDGKSKDGLKDVCGDCKRRRRKYASAPPVPQYDSYTPASALQPVLDQAIAERDELAAELDGLRGTVEAMQQSTQNQAPRTDLLALNAIETELRWLRERLEQQTPADPPLAKVARRGVSAAAGFIGPVAYRIFKWADKQVLRED